MQPAEDTPRRISLLHRFYLSYPVRHELRCEDTEVSDNKRTPRSVTEAPLRSGCLVVACSPFFENSLTPTPIGITLQQPKRLEKLPEREKRIWGSTKALEAAIK
eukprot:sb/3478031/